MTGFSNMFVLVNVILLLGVPAVVGQVELCSFPEIKHGILHDQKKYQAFLPVPIGKVFYYSCEYNFVSPLKSFWTQITCTEKGWSPTPRCLRLCFLPFVENGHSESSRKIHLQGDTVQIVCDKGYGLQNGGNSIVCTEGGWSAAPECRSLKNCSKSDITIDNGFLTESEHTYPLNKETPFKCKPGYTTADGKTSGTVTCLQDGWSMQPVCIKSCDMPVLVNARVRNISTRFMLSEQLEYECNDGHQSRDGHTTGFTVCGEDGWSHLPMCYEIECPLPFLEAYLDAHPKQEKYKVGDVLKFSCRQKFARVGPDSVQCYQFGWSPNFPTCKEQVQPCGPPPQLPNGKVKDPRKEEYGHGEVVQYECNSHFAVKGPNKIQCMDGEWTTLPTCVGPLQTCSSLPKLEHGYAQPSAPPYPHGATVELSCRSTHTMIGNHSVSCLSGMWTELPECVATDQLKKCSRSSLGSGIFFRPHMSEFNHNATISYRCIGSHSYMRTVCVNGNWNPKPSCTEKNKHLCPPPPQIPHAQNMTTTVNYQDGEKVAILCKENFQLQEVKELVCKNGQWQSLPQCIDATQSCGPPPPIDNGDITSFPLLKYPPGSRVGYSCQAFYELKGHGYVTCRNGRWSEPPKCLDACIISEENMNKNNIQLKWRDSRKLYAKTGDIVEFMCKDSYKAARHTSAFRAVCHEGKFEYPKCE